MQFRAGTAGTGIAHHPEVVSFAETENVNLGIQIRVLKQACPVIVRFLIELGRFASSRFVNGCVESLRGKFPAVDHKFPRPFDCFLLEIIAEAPVAEHFKEGVVISIEADVFEIVVFPAGPNAFLGVDHAWWIPDRFLVGEKNRDELIHAGVGKKQIGRVGQKR